MGGLVAIVDDDPRIRNLMQMELEDAGHPTLVCSRARELLCHERLGDVQLVLLDLMMPEMDGLACLRQLRQRNFNGQVVVVSALCDPRQRQQVLAAGANGYLVKTNLLEELDTLLQRL